MREKRYMLVYGERVDVTFHGGAVPQERITARLGADVADIPPPLNQPSAACAQYLMPGADGVSRLLSYEQYCDYQAARGVCGACDDGLPSGAKFCISCGAAVPPATGETMRLLNYPQPE